MDAQSVIGTSVRSFSAAWNSLIEMWCCLLVGSPVGGPHHTQRLTRQRWAVQRGHNLDRELWITTLILTATRCRFRHCANRQDLHCL